MSRDAHSELRFQTIDGTWEVVGKDQAAGVWAEQIIAVADRGGPSELTAVLHRDPRRGWLDLSGDTPVEYWRDNVKQWAGRIKKTPTSTQLEDTSINLVCAGWQAHLDDDTYEQVYVHGRLGDWVDTRSLLTASLGLYFAGGRVANDSGIVLSWPANQAQPANNFTGVTLDLGPNSTAARIVLDATLSDNDASTLFLVRGSNNGDGGVVTNDAVAQFFLNTTAHTYTIAGSFPTLCRYVHIAIFRGAAWTPGADVYAKLSRILVFVNASDELGNASVLKGDRVFKHALATCCPLLDADQSGIAAGSVSLPEFRTPGVATPRQVMEIVNRYEDRDFGVDVDKRPFWRSRATVATLETDAGFQTAPTDSDSIFNRVWVQATGPDDSPVQSWRTSAQQPGAVFDKLSSAQPANPGFEVNTSGWTVQNGPALIRDTGVFDSGVASARVDATGLGGTLYSTPISGLTIGRTYQVVARVRGTANLSSSRVYVGVYETVNGLTTNFTVPSGAFGTVAYTFTATAATMIFKLGGDSNGAGTTYYLDGVQVMEARPTIPDRRGFTRTFVLQPRAAQTQATADALGDVWLRNHIRAAFNGTTRIGRGECRTVLGAAPVRPPDLLLRYGERIRFADSRDPDTGASHRDGVVVKVTYFDDDDVAELLLDSDDENFQALQARQELLQGLTV